MAAESSVIAVIRASRPSFRNPHDKLAFAIHAAFMAAGYSLTATGKAAVSENRPTDGEEVGIEGWNELEDCYGFVYTKLEKGGKKAVLVKCLGIGDVLAVDVVDLGEPKKEPAHLQISVKDYVVVDGHGTSNYGDAYKNLKGLVERVNEGILAKVELKVETNPTGRSGDSSGHNVADEPAVGVSVSQPPHSPILVYPHVPSSGHSDLYPGPGAGFYPLRGPDIGGDMLVGPNDPRWFGSGERAGFRGGVPGVPQGARFDPYGPPGVPGFEPSRFVRGPQGPGGGTHPDLEHFRDPRDPDYI